MQFSRPPARAATPLCNIEVPMPITTIIFDFDGLILDTEGPDFRTWQEVYEEHDATLDIRDWQRLIGTTIATPDAFDPYEELERQLGGPIDRERLQERRQKRHVELVEKEVLLPGVERYLDDARALGLRLGVASTSRRDWVVGNLDRLGLTERFGCIRCHDDVGVPKPAPDVYLSALAGLDARASEVFALEDSPNGIRSAKGAGLFCVAVPNPLTQDLDLAAADLILTSLDEMPLAELLALVNGHPIARQ